MKLFVSLIALLGINAAICAQTWEKRETAGLKYEFPTPHQQVNSGNAAAISYSGENVLMTVTSLPDTTEFRPETQLARSRYYAATAASAMFRLRGKMVAANDTMIEDTHLHYSAIEIVMPDSAISKYELLQYFKMDTLYGYSCQYIMTDKNGLKLRDRFYNSITFSDRYTVSLLFALGLGGAVFAFIVLFVLLKRRSGARA